MECSHLVEQSRVRDLYELRRDAWNSDSGSFVVDELDDRQRMWHVAFSDSGLAFLIANVGRDDLVYTCTHLIVCESL